MAAFNQSGAHVSRPFHTSGSLRDLLCNARPKAPFFKKYMGQSELLPPTFKIFRIGFPLVYHLSSSFLTIRITRAQSEHKITFQTKVDSLYGFKTRRNTETYVIATYFGHSVSINTVNNIPEFEDIS